MVYSSITNNFSRFYVTIPNTNLHFSLFIQLDIHVILYKEMLNISLEFNKKCLEINVTGF